MGFSGGIVSQKNLVAQADDALRGEGCVAGVLGKFQALKAKRVSGAEIAGNHMIRGFAAERDEQLACVTQLLGKRSRFGKSLQHFRARPSP